MPLPYNTDALSPYMSSEALEFHHGKHHLAYVNTLNTLIAWTKFEEMSLGDIITSSEGKIFNNAAQIWNHNLFWNTLKINNWVAPEWKLWEMINESFGSFEEMKEKFKAESLGRFGSGWVWLVQKKEKLEIYSSPNAENPLTLWGEVLLGCDVWEHSYYIDTRNDRGQYIENFWNIVDWSAVKDRLR
jgi:Fe-Mn family superoxide dismutase